MKEKMMVVKILRVSTPQHDEDYRATQKEVARKRLIDLRKRGIRVKLVTIFRVYLSDNGQIKWKDYTLKEIEKFKKYA